MLIWLQEYMRKLGKCLLALHQDHHGGARPLLDLWVAEAIALICCVRVYNPEFLKVIDSSAMDGSQNSRLSKPLLVQHMVSAAVTTCPYRFACSSSLPVCAEWTDVLAGSCTRMSNFLLLKLWRCRQYDTYLHLFASSQFCHSLQSSYCQAELN